MTGLQDKITLPGQSGIKYPYYLVMIVAISLVLPLNSLAQEVKKIEVVADYTEYDDQIGNNAKKLMGNVEIKHEDVYMTCDSAYYFSEENILEAFSNVHAWQGDTLDLYGDYLKYDGNNKVAKIRNNVILIDKETRLTTDYVDHYFRDDFSYYIGGGKIVNGDNTLESDKGYYYSKQKLFHFKDSVVVINPDYTILSDTLKYQTQLEITYFEGPSEIISEENYIYCENGWYDTQNEISQFNQNALFKSENTSVQGDSLYYERQTGIGRAFKNVVLIDTSQDIILKGNRVIYYEDPEYAMATDSAVLIQLDNTDSLYVHADTLLSVPDTIEDRKIIRAYYHVKFYRFDFQGKCDSLTYSEIDSVFRFFGEPILWHESNQFTSELIELHIKNKQLNRLELIKNAFIISMEDSVKFNQIKGRNMTGYISNNKLKDIEVKGNAETIYYGKEKDKIIGVNKALSSNLNIFFGEKGIESIIYITQPQGTYYPLALFAPAQARLSDFNWYINFRPLNKDEIFIWKKNGTQQNSSNQDDKPVMQQEEKKKTNKMTRD